MSAPFETARRSALATVVTGVRFPFAAMNAAGTATTAGELRRLAASRTGAVVLPTTTVHPFMHPQFRTLHNPGFDKLLPLVRELAAETRPVVASIAGATADELAFLAKAFTEAGADVIEANLADPWVENTLAPFDDARVFAGIVDKLATAATRPCWVKLPDRPLPFAGIVTLLLEAGVRGVVVSNDFEGFERLQLEAPSPIDIVAVGPIDSGYEVTRALAKGARAVQITTTLRAEGPEIFARLEREMRRALDGAPAE